MSGWTVVLVTVGAARRPTPSSSAPSSPRCRRAAASSSRSPTQGSKRAAVALHAMQRTGLLLATAQLGITVCSVLLGAVSEAALHHALVPVAERFGVSEVVADVVALVVALAIVVFLHVVYGEMIPKNISIARPERSAVALVPALVMVSRGRGAGHPRDGLAVQGADPAVRRRAQGRGRVRVHRRGGRPHPRRVAPRGPRRARPLRAPRCRPRVQRQGRRRRRRAGLRRWSP